MNVTEGYTNLALVAKKRSNLISQKIFARFFKIYPKDHYLVIPSELELTNVFTAQKKYKLANLYLDSIAKKLPKKALSELNLTS